MIIQGSRGDGLSWSWAVPKREDRYRKGKPMRLDGSRHTQDGKYRDGGKMMQMKDERAQKKDVMIHRESGKGHRKSEAERSTRLVQEGIRLQHRNEDLWDKGDEIRIHRLMDQEDIGMDGDGGGGENGSEGEVEEDELHDTHWLGRDEEDG
ncbi:hypothetical protein BJ684DRAFT_16498 [Piptocephalis cylindrospora]|uniref:Uncharacterized protein n=1 Tax=Piptocephalis cylindrospora TaxID=1907219 RepID=A0A4P9Y318_9FUNG|nr:hypothetical protein BJ684DRAFT_16498 [Piptocephalis cylindrospora]|eukprot:RKP13064.1 hypothetical protein BJ684DRAFT_16498 [Piptocephalis cylindrospora]